MQLLLLLYIKIYRNMYLLFFLPQSIPNDIEQNVCKGTKLVQVDCISYSKLRLSNKIKQFHHLTWVKYSSSSASSPGFLSKGSLLGVHALAKLRKSHWSLSPSSALRYSFLPFRVLPVTVSFQRQIFLSFFKLYWCAESRQALFIYRAHFKLRLLYHTTTGS